MEGWNRGNQLRNRVSKRTSESHTAGWWSISFLYFPLCVSFFQASTVTCVEKDGEERQRGRERMKMHKEKCTVYLFYVFGVRGADRKEVRRKARGKTVPVNE